MSEQTASLLQVQRLSKSFADDKNGQNEIIRDVSITVNRRDFMCVLGPSGCGKTTFLRCIAGFEAYQGTILLDGAVVTKPSIDRVMVFQDFNQLFQWKTVRQNVSFPVRMSRKCGKDELAAITDEALRKVELQAYGDYYPHQLSGGMKQRVAIAKALALKPKLILMDEPFASLDAMTRKNLQAELLQLWRNNDMTVIFVTHNIQEAITLGTRIIVFSKQGHITVDDPVTLPKPVTPSTPGYGELWDRYNAAIGSADEEGA